MCGLVGLFRRRGEGADPDPRWIAAVERLAHRGPDDGTWWSEGPFFLGHRRLAIIGLEDGVQPMASASGRHVIAFNGEIYNYLELGEALRREGVVLRTASDTEVLLEGYCRWGAALLPRLEGMFAFSIIDRRDGTVFLARDRFGEKPLFLAETSDHLAWASEVKGLAAMGLVNFDWDEDALGRYLCLNYVPGTATLLQGIRRLAPGSWRLVGRDFAREGVWWSPAAITPVASPPPTIEAAAAALGPVLDGCVARSLRSDVPVGLLLSSGIDSAAVGQSAARQGMVHRAYCLDFPDTGHGEASGAQRTADRLGLSLAKVPMGSEALDDFLAVIDHGDDPNADSSALAVYTLARAVSRDLKVVISGDGGDELFGGYLTYRADRLHAALVSRLPMPLRRLVAGLAGFIPVSAGKVSASYKAWRFLRAAALPTAQAHFTWNGTWLPHAAAALTPARPQTTEITLARLAVSLDLEGRSDATSLMAADCREYLPNDILAKVDRMTMAHGLESRAPLLMPEVAEFALSLPAEMRVPARGPGKPVLRRLVADRLGADVAAAPKQGFSIPIHDWLRGRAAPLMDDLLAPNSISRLGVLSPGAVSQAVAAHRTGTQLGFELWGLMVLVAWFDRISATLAGMGSIPPARPARRLHLPAFAP